MNSKFVRFPKNWMSTYNPLIQWGPVIHSRSVGYGENSSEGVGEGGGVEINNQTNFPAVC